MSNILASNLPKESEVSEKWKFHSAEHDKQLTGDTHAERLPAMLKQH
jgi:hypothetical protein